jgi:hypothetical protein
MKVTGLWTRPVIRSVRSPVLYRWTVSPTRVGTGEPLHHLEPLRKRHNEKTLHVHRWEGPVSVGIDTPRVPEDKTTQSERGNRSPLVRHLIWLRHPKDFQFRVRDGVSSYSTFENLIPIFSSSGSKERSVKSCLLLIEKTRGKDKTYTWLSVRWKTKT